MNKLTIKFELNGKPVEVEVSPKMTLLELLRQNFRLTAAKEGCGKGECGACTILLNSNPINCCLKLAASLTANDKVETLEGLANDKIMQTLQQSYVDEGSVQCGFCIPGMVISSYALLKKNDRPTDHEIKQALSGNICRCTGYIKIEAGVKDAAMKVRK